jgi:hypothetical protein
MDLKEAFPNWGEGQSMEEMYEKVDVWGTLIDGKYRCNKCGNHDGCIGYANDGGFRSICMKCNAVLTDKRFKMTR